MPFTSDNSKHAFYTWYQMALFSFNPEQINLSLLILLAIFSSLGVLEFWFVNSYGQSWSGGRGVG